MTHPPSLNPEADALFLDFDGTLTAIVDRPENAQLSGPETVRLAALLRRMHGAIAILSGRALSSLDERLPPGFWRVGGHGAELAAPGRQAAPDHHRRERAAALAVAIRSRTAHLRGVQLEEKPFGAALHFRAVPEAGPACCEVMAAEAGRIGGFEIQHGKMVVEARPAGVDKGQALEKLARAAPFAGRRPIMIGDDLTDEPAMQMARSLGGLAIKVGPGDSCAGFRLPGPDGVHQWLEEGLTRSYR